jgi:SAM-dependent methyltransferase
VYWIERQFERPTGILGAVLGTLMAMANSPLAGWALSLLDLEPGDRILEVGCGAGAAVHKLQSQLPNSTIAAVDHSSTMIRQARRLNEGAVRAGHLSLLQAAASGLPFADGAFDKVFTINSVQYWPEFGENLKEIHRVLRPGGVVLLVLRPRWAKSQAEVHRIRGVLSEGLQYAGFWGIESGVRPSRGVTTAFARGHAGVRSCVISESDQGETGFLPQRADQTAARPPSWH